MNYKSRCFNPDKLPGDMKLTMQLTSSWGEKHKA